MFAGCDAPAAGAGWTSTSGRRNCIRQFRCSDRRAFWCQAGFGIRLQHLRSGELVTKCLPMRACPKSQIKSGSLVLGPITPNSNRKVDEHTLAL